MAGSKPAGEAVSKPVWTLEAWFGLAMLLLFVLGFPFLIVMVILEEREQHAKDLRIDAEGQPRLGIVRRSRMGTPGPRSYSPSWSEVEVETEAGVLMFSIIRGYYDSGTQVEMLYLPEEGRCDGLRAVRGRLCRWPFTDTLIIGLMVLVVCGGGLGIAYCLDRKRQRGRVQS